MRYWIRGIDRICRLIEGGSQSQPVPGGSSWHTRVVELLVPGSQDRLVEHFGMSINER